MARKQTKLDASLALIKALEMKVDELAAQVARIPALEKDVARWRGLAKAAGAVLFETEPVTGGSPTP